MPSPFLRTIEVSRHLLHYLSVDHQRIFIPFNLPCTLVF